MITRLCDARSACRWLILLVLGAMISQPAGALGSSDILYLNKYGEGISNVSWCNDRAFTRKTYGPSRLGSAFGTCLPGCCLNLRSISSDVVLSTAGAF